MNPRTRMSLHWTVSYDESIMAFVNPFKEDDLDDVNVECFETKAMAVKHAKDYMRSNIQALRDQIKITGKV